MKNTFSPIAFALFVLAAASPLLLSLSTYRQAAQASESRDSQKEVSESRGAYKHILLLSVDGLRQADVSDPRLQRYLPNILSLAQKGVSYTKASTSKPSDSFPGTLAYLTGAGPKTTGVYYDDSYSRLLTAPGGNAASPRGTEVLLAENLDKDTNLLNGGGNSGVDSIDPAKLPLDCNSGTCKPVYPHSYLKVNTIFEVAKAAGLYTAFSDKHPAYDLANGPSGKGVDDLYTPEINSLVLIKDGKLVNDPNGKVITSSIAATILYDDLKVTAIQNEIAGYNSSRTKRAPVPAIFGMNFQAVSVAEKDRANGGIAEDGTPSQGLIDALSNVDAKVGQMIDSLKSKGLYNSTLIVLTAKHGQNPRIGKATLIKDDVFTNVLQQANIEVVQATQDDVALLWLKDHNQTEAARRLLQSLKNANPDVGVDKVLDDKQLAIENLGNDFKDRTPDLIVKLKPGFVLVGKPATSNKRAEHGGLSADDTQVALIVGGGRLPGYLRGKVVTQKVTTTQIAVTALKALGLNPDDLQGAKAENTKVLPGF